MNSVALVTGAGSGIGRCVAALLARAGWRLVIVGRTRAHLSETAALAGPDALIEVVGGDVSDPFQCGHAVARCVERFGRLDALVNNAGMGEATPIERHTPELIARTLNVNVLGPACLIRAAWSVFAQQRARDSASRGVVVNVSSMASFDPFPGFFAYGASKAALDMLTLTASREGESIGVRAFSVNPGAVETALLRSTFDESVVPPGAALEPDAVARVVVECIDGHHDALNGQRIPVLPASAASWYASARDGARWPEAIVVEPRAGA